MERQLTGIPSKYDCAQNLSSFLRECKLTAPTPGYRDIYFSNLTSSFALRIAAEVFNSMSEFVSPL